MPPLQASGKRREFDLKEGKFVCNLNYENRGGGRSPAKPVSDGCAPPRLLLMFFLVGLASVRSTRAGARRASRCAAQRAPPVGRL